MHLTFRSLLLLGGFALSLTAQPALAQLRDTETAGPAHASSLDEQGELLRYFTNALQLQPHQVLALRRAWVTSSATDTTAASTSLATELRQVLTPTQRARLEQLHPESAVAARLRLVALAQ